MSAEDKAANKVDALAGKAKEAVGRVTGNPDLEEAGKRQQVKSDLKQAGEKVKDAFK
ncbi:CsbD family protein [Geodermatophilus sp. SYSU D00684]